MTRATLPRGARALALLALVALGIACRDDTRARTAFDGERALGYIETQLEFGPRIPGSIGWQRTGDWIVAQMRERADTVIEQRWTHVTESGDSIPMRNILARINVSARERVLYVAHWDTRPISDGVGVPLEQRQIPVPGANDGASGVALLIGVADALRSTPPGVGVDLLFVDGEDYGSFIGEQRDVLIGSRYFARNLPDPGYRPLFGVVWDMIGDADLRIPQEGYSVQRAPEVVRLVWTTASAMGYGRYFIPEVGVAVTDDHLPLLDVGLRVINVIDLDYPPHHTPHDTFDKVSARSLQVVGDVAVGLVTNR